MTLLIEWPLLALIPAALLLAYSYRTTRRVSWIAGVAWAAYALYELGMKLRILCTGECNIRIDLLVVYPALLVVTVAAFLFPLLGWDNPHARHGIDTGHD